MPETLNQGSLLGGVELGGGGGGWYPGEGVFLGIHYSGHFLLSKLKS